MRRTAVTLLALLSLTSCTKLAKKIVREMRDKQQSKTVAEAPDASRMTQSFAAPNGLITAHYPPDFAAKVTGKSALMMSRNIDGDDTELVTLVSVADPISPDLGEFTRTVALSEVKKLDGYQQVSRNQTRCGGVDAVEILSTWKPAGVTYRRRWCGFVRNGHGYAFAYTLPETEAAHDEELLRAIVDATTFDK
jgi:hypothetical protein